jgi:pilus assembly protein CpaE
MSTSKSLIIISEDTLLKQQILEGLKEYQDVEVIKPFDAAKELDRLSPDIAIVAKPVSEQSVELVQSLHAINPSLSILFVSDAPDFTLLREVIRVGAIDFFVLPDEMELLNDSIKKTERLIESNRQRQDGAQQSFKKGRGKVISFYSGKGGSGTTLLSTGFSQTLKLDSTAQVLFIDLNLQFGGAEAFLGIDGNRTLVDLKPVIDELNESHIKNVTQKEKHSSLEILLSPRDAESAEAINEEFISKLLRTCRRAYDYVIIDLPSYMNEVSLTALEESDLIYYVINLDTPSLRVFKSAEELFNRLSINTDNRLELIFNQVGRDNELSVSDFKQLIEKPVAAEVSRDFKGIQNLINSSTPLRKEPNEKKITAAAKDLKKWVASTLD